MFGLSREEKRAKAKQQRCAERSEQRCIDTEDKHLHVKCHTCSHIIEQGDAQTVEIWEYHYYGHSRIQKWKLHKNPALRYHCKLCPVAYDAILITVGPRRVGNDDSIHVDGYPLMPHRNMPAQIFYKKVERAVMLEPMCALQPTVEFYEEVKIANPC